MTIVKLTSPDCGQHNECQDAPPPPGTPELTAVLRYLDTLETVGWRMIAGIRHFLACTMWAWMWKQLISFSRIAVKTVRVFAVFACWAAICFGPWLLCQGVPGVVVLMAVAWTALALGGSVWGALYIRHQLRPPATHSRLSIALRRIIHLCRGMRRLPNQEKSLLL